MAEVLLSFRVDVAIVDSGADQPLAREAELFGLFARGQLAAAGITIPGSTCLRIFLGNVELLFVAEMDLSYARSPIPARVRNAVARLPRLHSVRVGIVRAEKFHLAQGAEAAVVKSPLRIAQCDYFVTLRAWRSIHFVIFFSISKPPAN